MKWLPLLCVVLLSGCDVENRISDIKVSDIYDECTDCSLIVRQMAWSLDNDPQYDQARLCKANGRYQINLVYCS